MQNFDERKFDSTFDYGSDDVYDHGAREFVKGNIAEWSAADFASIHTRFRPHLERHARRYLTNSVQAEEVVQEAFLYLMMTLPEIDSELGVLKFLKWKIRLLALDVLRSASLKKEVPVDYIQELSSEEEVGLDIERAEDNAVIQLALSKLSPRQREALIATVYEERSHEELASSMGLTANGFRQLLFRARQSFRFALIGEAETRGRSASEILSLAAKKAAQGARDNASRVGALLVMAALVTGVANSQFFEPSPSTEVIASDVSVPVTKGPVAPEDPGSVVESAPQDQQQSTTDIDSRATSPEGDVSVASETSTSEIKPVSIVSDAGETSSVGGGEFETVLSTNVDQAGIYTQSYAKKYAELFEGESIEIFGGTGISAFIDLVQDNESIGASIFQVNVDGVGYVAVPRETQQEHILSETGSTLVLIANDFFLVSDDGRVISDSPLARAKASVTLELDNRGNPSYASLVVEG